MSARASYENLSGQLCWWLFMCKCRPRSDLSREAVGHSYVNVWYFNAENENKPKPHVIWARMCSTEVENSACSPPTSPHTPVSPTPSGAVSIRLLACWKGLLALLSALPASSALPLHRLSSVAVHLLSSFPISLYWLSFTSLRGVRKGGNEVVAEKLFCIWFVCIWAIFSTDGSGKRVRSQ